jgi:hypothetical protein
LTAWTDKVEKLRHHIKEKEKYIGIGVKNLEAYQFMLKKDKDIAERLSYQIAHQDEQLDPEFEEVFEDEVSEFEERRRLKEIIRHEQVLDDDEDNRKEHTLRMTLQKKEEDEQREQEIEHRKLRKDREALARRRRQFEEFQKVTKASEVGDLVPRIDYLEYFLLKFVEIVGNLFQEWKAKSMKRNHIMIVKRKN